MLPMEVGSKDIELGVRIRSVGSATGLDSARLGESPVRAAVRKATLRAIPQMLIRYTHRGRGLSGLYGRVYHVLRLLYLSLEVVRLANPVKRYQLRKDQSPTGAAKNLGRRSRRLI